VPRACLEGSSGVLLLDFEGSAVRIVKIRGEPWWVALDVCRALGISNNSDAVSRLDPDEKDEVGITDPIGRKQMTTVVDESGVYELIFASRKPEARRFKKWVKREVLPSIRRTGTYSLHSSSRVAKQAKRLRADHETAKIRCDQIDINKASNARLAARALLARRSARPRS
jgi:prophage antirepressor-like protein